MNNEENRNREELVAQKNRLKAIMSQYQSQLDTKIEDLSSRVEKDLDIPVARYTEKQPEKAIGKSQKISTPSSTKLDEFTKKLQEAEAKLKEEQEARKKAAEREAQLAMEKRAAERQAKLAAEKQAAEQKAKLAAEKEAAKQKAQVEAEKRKAERQAKERSKKQTPDAIVETNNESTMQEKELAKSPQMTKAAQEAPEGFAEIKPEATEETKKEIPKIPLEAIHLDIPWVIPKKSRELAAEKARAQVGPCETTQKSRKAKKRIHEYAREVEESPKMDPLAEQVETGETLVEKGENEKKAIFEPAESTNIGEAGAEKATVKKVSPFVQEKVPQKSVLKTARIVETPPEKTPTPESTEGDSPLNLKNTQVKSENLEEEPIVEGTLQNLEVEQIQSDVSALEKAVKGTDQAEDLFTQALQKVKQTPEAQEAPEEIEALEVSDDYLEKASAVTDTEAFLDESEDVRDNVCDLFDINGEEIVHPVQNERFVPAIPEVKTYKTAENEPDFIETLNEFGEEEALEGHKDELGEFRTPLDAEETQRVQIEPDAPNLSDGNPVIDPITPTSEQETVQKNPFFEDNPALKKRFEEDPNLEIESTYETIPLVDPMRAVRQMLKTQHVQKPKKEKNANPKDKALKTIKPIDHIEDTHRLKRYEKDQVLHFFDTLEAEKKDEKVKEKKPKEDIGAFPYIYEKEAEEQAPQDQIEKVPLIPVLLLSAALIATGIFCILIARDFTGVDTLILITLGIGMILTMDNSMTTAMYMSIGIMAVSILGYGYLIFVRQMTIGILHALWMLLIPACMLTAANLVEAFKGTAMDQTINGNENRK